MTGVCCQVVLSLTSTNEELDTWGFADVEAAVAAIPQWIAAVGWKGPSIDTNRWLVSGHSSGGRCSSI